MNNEKSAISILLRQLSELLDSLDESDFSKIGDGRLELTLSQVRLPKKEKPQIQGTQEPIDDLPNIKRRLSEFTSREEAEKYLSANSPRKSDLVSLAKEMNIPIHAADTGDKIRDKIIDATVGYRLRSQAIRGNT